MHNTSLLLVALLAIAGLSHALLTEKEYQDGFTAWMQKHQKSYTSGEFQSRYAIYKSNLDYVNEWNAVHEDTKLDTNHLADLTNEEYRTIYLGTRVNAAQRLAEAVPSDVITVGLPTSVDWRTSGAVTAIKNQGQCGSCWSFSTTGSVEGIHKISSGNLVSLSEQNLMDCSTKQGNQGCNGGLMDDAFEYIIANKGIDTEASYPYKAVQGTCHFTTSNIGATITGYKDIAAGSETDLQAASVNQPISVAIDASHTSFQLYSTGVYYEPACSTSQLDHGVLVIGYGTSGSSDYWLVKNSWGTTWGQQGYIWMSRNKKNNCGIASSASYPTVDGSSTGSATTSRTVTDTTASHSTTRTNTNTNTNSNTDSTTYTGGINPVAGRRAQGGKGFNPTNDQAGNFEF